MNRRKYTIIGLMSGTSLDGLDIALCEFVKTSEASEWQYRICASNCVSYSSNLKSKLQEAHQISIDELKKLETEWTTMVCKVVNEFMNHNQIILEDSVLDGIAFHGHTILHNPEEGYTFQMGNGAMLAARTGVKVICDFRQMDVALGGQGAPLVPIGDALLFSQYDVCLNLGGIANISLNHSGTRKAFDCAPCNMVLNFLAQQLGQEYDKDALLALQGKVNEPLLKILNDVTYYAKSFPKSLGREDIEKDFLPLFTHIINTDDASQIKDALHTFTLHSAYQIAQAINSLLVPQEVPYKLLVTGGGAYNPLLIRYLSKYLSSFVIESTDRQLTEFKEALIFAFLGLLRLRGEVNVLSSVTGAAVDSCSGAVYLPS